MKMADCNNLHNLKQARKIRQSLNANLLQQQKQPGGLSRAVLSTGADLTGFRKPVRS
jgi:hypothetical protein